MRTTQVLALLGKVAAVAAVAVGAGFFVWERGTVKPARWVVSDVRDGQRTLTINWAMGFAYCAQRPSVDVEEGDAEVRIQANYRQTRGAGCEQEGRRYYPVVVRLSRPLAGRRLVGEGQSTVPVPWLRTLANPFSTMPSLIGMDAGAARRALSRARYPATALPPDDAVGFVTRQLPVPGTILGKSGHRPTGRPPELRFGSQVRP